MSTSIFRFFPRDALKEAEVRHYLNVSGPQGYSEDADETVFGALVRLTRYQRAMMGGNQRFQFLFFIKDDADVRESDKVTIDNVVYKVANVDTYEYGSVPHRAALLTTP